MTQETKNGGITLDETRTALLSGYVRKTKLLTTETGVSIELREPTVAQRGRMLSAGGVSAANADITDIAAMQISAVIECSYHPGSGKRLFNNIDEEAIAALPTASWFDDVANAAMALMSEEPDAAGKPSSKTPSDSTSLPSPENLAELSAS